MVPTKATWMYATSVANRQTYRQTARWTDRWTEVRKEGMEDRKKVDKVDLFVLSAGTP